MYKLFLNKKTLTMKIKKETGKWPLYSGEYPEEATRYNDNYFICKIRKPLLEKGREIQQQWVEEAEKEVEEAQKRLEEFKNLKVK